MGKNDWDTYVPGIQCVTEFSMFLAGGAEAASYGLTVKENVCI